MIGKDKVKFIDDNIVILNRKTCNGTEGLFRLLYYTVYAPYEF